MSHAAARSRMVERDLAGRGISDPAVLRAFLEVRREDFLPEDLQQYAYSDRPLPIGDDQTISQPFIVALTASALQLRGDERVLDVGTGSGYAAAILSCLVDEVYSIERIESLAVSARQRLASLGYDNVRVEHGDGTEGLSEYAPYQGIAVAAAAEQVPPALEAQLAVGGRLVIPVGASASTQVLLRITRRDDDRFLREPLCPVRFVPLIGAIPA